MTDPYVPDRGDDSFVVSRYDLALDYRPTTNALDGRARLSVTARQHLTSLELDLVGLGVDKVSVDGRAVRYRHRGGRLRVTTSMAEGQQALLEVRYSGHPGPQRGPWGSVGWEELSDGVLVAGQPDGAATWFPCNDHPGVKAPFRITVSCASSYAVIANGVLTSKVTRSSRTTWVYEQVEPMATYLATVQIGRYDEVVLTPAPLPQVARVPARLRQRAAADLARQPDMMMLFERYFGPYPFEGYTVVVTDDDLEIPLEAQGISVFGANHVDGRRGSERLVAHELAHQWFGNSVTVAGWQHLWLNEGFACYAEWLWSEGSGGSSAEALAVSARRRLSSLPQDLLLSDPGPALMFDDRLYKRGALTLHALRRSVGDEVFFALLRDWTQVHRHGVVTTADFLQHVGPEGAAVMHPWLFERALPGS